MRPSIPSAVQAPLYSALTLRDVPSLVVGVGRFSGDFFF